MFVKEEKETLTSQRAYIQFTHNFQDVYRVVVHQDLLLLTIDVNYNEDLRARYKNADHRFVFFL